MTAPSPAPTRELSTAFSSTRPTIPASIAEYFLPNNLTFTQAFKAAGREYPPEAMSQGLVYRPVVLAQASARIINLKYKLDTDTYKTVVVENPDRRGVIRWDNYTYNPIEPNSLDSAPDPQARFASLEAPLNDVKLLTALHKDFLDWAYRTTQVTVRSNEALKLYAGPEVSSADFRTQCADAARQARDADIKKASTTFDSKLRTLQDKLEREQRELEQDRSELSGRKLEEAGNVAETVAGFLGFGRKRSISTSLTKRRLTSQAKNDVEESVDAIKEYQKEIAALEEEKAAALQAVSDKWGDVANQITEFPIAAQKKDLMEDYFGVAWMPHHLVKIGEQVEELPGFSAK